MDIKKLADLARIKIDETELAGLAKDLEAVVAYVSELEDAGAEAGHGEGELRNVMRPDTEPFAERAYTDAIIKNMPQSEDGYLKVKKIIGA